MIPDSQLLPMWGPRCSGRSATVALHGEGRVTVTPAIIDAVRALNDVLRRHDYRTRAFDTGAYACRLKVSGNGWSPHAYKVALDLNWTTNPYGPRLITDMSRAMVDEILALRTNSGAQLWQWGGDWRGNKDAMHYQIATTPAHVATGVRGRSPGASPPPYTPVVPSPTPVPPPTYPDLRKDDDMRLIRLHDGTIFLVYADGHRRHVTDANHVPWLENFLGVTLFDVGPGTPFANPLVSLIYGTYFNEPPTA